MDCKTGDISIREDTTANYCGAPKPRLQLAFVEIILVKTSPESLGRNPCHYVSLQEALKRKNHRHFPGKQSQIAPPEGRDTLKKEEQLAFFSFLLLCFELFRKIVVPDVLCVEKIFFCWLERSLP